MTTNFITLTKTASDNKLQETPRYNNLKSMEDEDLNKTMPENILNLKPLLNADLASLDQLSED